MSAPPSPHLAVVGGGSVFHATKRELRTREYVRPHPLVVQVAEILGGNWRRGREGTREGGREGRKGGGREGGEGGRECLIQVYICTVCYYSLSQSLTPSISPSLTPSLHLSLTLIGALANGAQVLSSAVDKPDKRVHVSLAAIAADWSPCSVVHQLEGSLGRWRREGGREKCKKQQLR